MEIKKFVLGPIEVNTYLVYDESGEAFLVDPGDYSPECVALINEKALNLAYIILTHGHGDHIGGVEEFIEKFPNCKIVAAEGEKDFLANPRANGSLAICGRPVSLTADIWVKDNEKLSVGDMELRFITTPGHTKGGMCILVEDVLFSGDTLFRFSIGRVDFPESSERDMYNSIKNKLYKLPEETLVYPGHMSSTTIGLEKKMNPYVRG